MVGLMYILFMVAIFYFLLIRPQQKKQKAAYAMQSSLAKGDKIVTIGGVHAEIFALEELALIVKLYDGTKIKIDKGAVRNVVESAAAPAPAPVEPVAPAVSETPVEETNTQA